MDTLGSLLPCFFMSSYLRYTSCFFFSPFFHHWGRLQDKVTEVKFINKVLKTHTKLSDKEFLFLLVPSHSDCDHRSWLSRLFRKMIWSIANFPSSRVEFINPSPYFFFNEGKTKWYNLGNLTKCCIITTEWVSQAVSQSVQSLSRVRLFATPWIAAHQASLFITISRSSLKLTSIKSVMPSSHLTLCHLPFLLSPIPSTSESFPMSQLFPWGGQSTGVSALASFLPKKSQGWSPLEWAGWISLQSKGLSRVFSNITVQKHQFFSAQLSSQSNSHIHIWPQEKP